MPIIQSNRLTWIFLVVVSLIGGWLCIDSGHEFGDDFILYVDQAERFWNAGQYRWLELENQWCMQHSDQLIGPYLYPRGFPGFLSMFIGWKSILGWKGIKFINYLVFVASAVVFLIEIGRKFKIRPSHVFLLAALLIWNPKIWEAADRLQSDLFFTTTVMCFWVVWWKPIKSIFIRWVVISAIVFIATETKTNGILLLVPVIFNLGFIWVKSSQTKFAFSLSSILPTQDSGADLGKARGTVLWATLSTLCAGFIALWIERNTGANHWSELYASDWTNTMVDNFLQYWGMLGALPVWHVMNGLKLMVSTFGLPLNLVWLLFATIPIAAFYFLFKVRFNYAVLEMAMFTVSTLLLLTLWPSQQGVRMLFPILPLWLIMLHQIGISLHAKINFISPKLIQYRKLRNVAFLLVFVQAGLTAKHYQKIDTNQAFSEDMLGVANFIKHETENEAVVSFFKPRLLRYMTGKRIIRIQNSVNYSGQIIRLDAEVSLDSLVKSDVKYFIAPTWDYQQLLVQVPKSTGVTNGELALIQLKNAQKVYQNRQFVVLDLGHYR